MKINASNRQKLLIIGIVIAAVLLIGDRAVLGPLLDSWRSRTAEIARLQKNVAEGRSVIARAAHTQARWAEMQTQALPKDPAQAEQELISAFDRWGRASAIEVGSIKPQWKRGTNNRTSLLECRVDASGNIATLTRFLYELEKSPLALRVDSVEFTARDEFGQRMTLGLLVSGLRLAPLEGKP